LAWPRAHLLLPLAHIFHSNPRCPLFLPKHWRDNVEVHAERSLDPGLSCFFPCLLEISNTTTMIPPTAAYPMSGRVASRRYTIELAFWPARTPRYISMISQTTMPTVE